MILRLFGTYVAQIDGRPLPPPRTRKSLWLLALLALREGREVDRAWLAGLLWPDSAHSPALYNVRRALVDLRRILGPEAPRLCSPTPSSLSLDLAGAQVDVIAFDAAIAQGDEESLRDALELYRGPLLEECTEEWVLQERGPRAEAYVAALETLAQHAMARGEPASAAHYLRRLVAVDPLRDSAQRALMEVFAGGGEFAAATQVYREFRLLLYHELNAAPDPETIESYRRIRAAARQRLVAPHSAGCLVPDSRVPFEPGIEQRAPATGRRPPVAGHQRLPRPLTRLVGREPEARRLQELLSPRNDPHPARLVTLTGPGGVGKTRLAIQVAEECGGEFPDGAWFVDLTALTALTSGDYPALVLQAVASALGVREQSDRSLTTTLQEFLRARELLLVLDNCEHLLPACAGLAEALLSACPGLRILATSRQSLGLTGEVTWPLPGLSVPGVQEELTSEPERLNAQDRVPAKRVDFATPGAGPAASGPPSPERLLQFDAVRLFVERAKEATAAFALTERTAGQVAQICRQLDGLPLAIELAAARLKALAVHEIAGRLDDRFSLLTGGSRTALPRQQTLRAAMDWSYELLSEPERLLLQRLSVFAGSFTLEAVESVCGEVLDLLSQLVDKSLVVVELAVFGGECSVFGTAGLDTEHPPPNTETRYRLLETVRQYARERLREAPGEAEVVGEGHARFYRVLAEEAAPHLAGPDQVAWLERLNAERSNLRAALEWSLEHAPETALGLAAALAGFWEERWYLAEGRQWLAAALDRAAPARPSPAGAAALVGASALAMLQDDRPAAHVLLEESLAIRRELGDSAGIAASLAHLAHLTFVRDDYPAARALYEESLAIQKERGDQAGIATVLTGLGHLARREEAYAAARLLHEESLEIRQALGDRFGMGRSLSGLGDAARGQGDVAAARAYYEAELAIWRELGDRAGVAGALGRIADVAQMQGDYAEARRLREESLALWRAAGSRIAVLHSLGALGHLAREQGQYQEARRCYADSLRLRQEAGDPFTIVQSLEDFAELAGCEQQWERLTRLLGAAEALREVIGRLLTPRARTEYDRILAGARAALPEAAVSAAWEAGRALIRARGGHAGQAIAFALQENSPAPVPPMGPAQAVE